MRGQRYKYNVWELRQCERADLLADAEHAEEQAANGPYYPERGITAERLREYAADCRRRWRRLIASEL